MSRWKIIHVISKNTTSAEPMLERVYLCRQKRTIFQTFSAYATKLNGFTMPYVLASKMLEIFLSYSVCVTWKYVWMIAHVIKMGHSIYHLLLFLTPNKSIPIHLSMLVYIKIIHCLLLSLLPQLSYSQLLSMVFPHVFKSV